MKNKNSLESLLDILKKEFKKLDKLDSALADEIYCIPSAWGKIDEINEQQRCIIPLLNVLKNSQDIHATKNLIRRLKGMKKPSNNWLAVSAYLSCLIEELKKRGDRPTPNLRD